MEASALRRQHGVALPRSRRLLAALGDDRLVEQVRRGNEAAFEVIYDRHHRGILSFCRHMLGSREEAEDAVQHTFTSAYTDLQANDREIRLKAWLYTIARNRCLTMLRARREQPAQIDDQPTAGLAVEVEQRADLRDLLHDLRDLPDDQREALVLFEVGDLPQAEVARVIGVDPMKVKALVFQARSSLIEKREARAIPCAEIREQLATATGGALRRGPLRRHLRVCEGCSEYRDQVRTQRSALALILPVAPTVGLKDGILSTIGFGGGAGGAGLASGGAAGGAAGSAAFGGSSAGGGLLAAIAGTGGAKLAVAAVIAGGGLIGGGVAVQNATENAGPANAEAADEGEPASRAATGGSGDDPGASGTPIANGSERSGDRDGDGKRDADEERDSGKDDERRSDDERGGDDEAKSERRRARGQRGNGNRRGASNHGSRRSGKSRGRGTKRSNGRKGPRPPRGPRPAPTNTDSDSDSGSSGGTTDSTTDRNSGVKEPKPPVVSAPTGTDGAGVEAPKQDGRERVLALVPPAE